MLTMDVSLPKNDKLGVRLNVIYRESLNCLRKYSPNSIAVEKIFANKKPRINNEIR